MHEKPLILLTNDDGIDAPYLTILANYLVEEFGAELLVVAPEKQRSAASHMITLHKPLRVDERRTGVFAVSGTPVDCVYLGIQKLAQRRPDLVISGPNDGFNAGTDVFYSGTVGGAMEGALRGLPAIAVSIGYHGQDSVLDAAKLVSTLSAQMIGDPSLCGTVLNVNVPPGWEGRVRWTCLGQRRYRDDVTERSDPRGRRYYWIGGGTDQPEVDYGEGTDCAASIREGIASVTPLLTDLTATELLAVRRSSWSLGYVETE